MAHLFYWELTETIVNFLKNIPVKFNLYVSTSPENGAAIRTTLLNSFPGKKIVLKAVRNRGFDMAPFVCDFGDCYGDYDLVLKLHTKKTSHVPWLQDWGSYLLKNTAGSPKVVSSILRMFSENKNLGLVYPEIIPALKKELAKDFWQGNWTICRGLGSRLGLSIRKEMFPDFPAGSMFWFRPKALEPLFRLGFMPEDFPEGKRIRRNGTLAHAMERLLVLIAEKEGFSSRTLCFEPFATVRDGSFWGRVRSKAYCEWNRILDFLGVNR